MTKKVNKQVTEIHVEIMPDAEFNEDQNYRDNLLGLLPAGFKGNFRKAEGAINAYAKVFHNAGVGLSLLAKWKMRFLLLQ